MTSTTSDNTYTLGHSATVLKSHTARTVHNSAAFLLPHLAPHMSLLDIGCGPGTITLGFCSHVSQVVGVDTSDSVIAGARKLAAERGISNASFQTGNVFALPFEDECFDVVYAHQLFVHLPNQVSALRELRRLLKPNGILATRDADTFHWSPSLPGLELWVSALHRMAISGGAAVPTGRQMHVWARQAGFDREKMIVGVGTTGYASQEERDWWSAQMVERVEGDEGYRRRQIESGTSEEELRLIVRDLKRWAKEEDGWYALLQSENLCWK